jgi:hypothetical protein
MPTPVVAFGLLGEAVDQYGAVLAEGYPAPGTSARGNRGAISVLSRRLGLSARGTLQRLQMAEALGFDVPSIPTLSEPQRESVRRRYRFESQDYVAWASAAARRGDLGGPPIPAAAKPPPGFEVKQNAGAYDADGNLLRQWVKTRQAPGDVFDPPPAHQVKGVSALVDQTGRVINKWVKTREGAIGEGLVEAMQDAFGRFAGAAPLSAAPAHLLGQLCTIYPLPDLHLGMYAWAAETDASYDMGIAVRRAAAMYRSLIPQTPASETAVLLVLGDFFHANDAKGVTPRSGHRLDVDGRWPKVYAAGADLVLEVADLLSQRHGHVEVVVLEGNHDPDAAVTMRVALRIFYRDHPRIAVEGSASLFWYRRFGKCLLAATHGHTVKLDRLGGVMSADCPADWGETAHRHWFTGHVHHERALELPGCRVESLNTIAGRDAWLHGGGYRSGHALQAITFHAEGGEVTRCRVALVPDRLRVRVPCLTERA